MTTTRRPHLLRRLAGAALASTAVAFGGVAAIPVDMAQAAGVDASAPRHRSSAVGTDGPAIGTARAPARGADRTTMRLRVDAGGDVID